MATASITFTSPTSYALTFPPATYLDAANRPWSSPVRTPMGLGLVGAKDVVALKSAEPGVAGYHRL